MNIIVADSSSLILLTKCNLLEVLLKLFPVIIPEAVFQEVVNKDTLSRFADAKILSGLVSENKLRIVKVAPSAASVPFSLGSGEAEALMLAKQTEDSILATDDGKAIKACRYLGVPFIISPRITTELYRMRAVDLDLARCAIEKMRIIGRYSPDIIAEAILELEVIRNAETHNR